MMKWNKTLPAFFLVLTMLVGGLTLPAFAGTTEGGEETLTRLHYMDFEENPMNYVEVNNNTNFLSKDGQGVMYPKNAGSDLVFTPAVGDYNTDDPFLQLAEYRKITLSYSVGYPENYQPIPLRFRINGYTFREGAIISRGTRWWSEDLQFAEITKDGKLYAQSVDASNKVTDQTLLTTLTPGEMVNLTVVYDRDAFRFDYYLDDAFVCSRTYAADHNIQRATRLIPVNNHAQGTAVSADMRLIFDNIAIYGGGLSPTGDNSAYFESVFPSMRGNRFSGVSMTLNRDISMHFYARLNDVKETDTVALRVAHEGRTLTLPEITRSTITEGRTEHRFSYEDIGPQNLARTFSVTLLVNDVPVLTKESYSAAAYCDTLLAGKPDETTKALIDALYTYGNAAKYYIGATQTAPELPEGTIPAATDETFGITQGTKTRILSANILFDCKNRLRITFETTEEIGDVFAVASWAGSTGQFFDAADVHHVKDDVYYIETDGIAPTDFDTVFTFAIGADAELVYSVNTYLSRMQEKTDIGILARATYFYGMAAEAWFGAHFS